MKEMDGRIDRETERDRKRDKEREIMAFLYLQSYVWTVSQSTRYLLYKGSLSSHPSPTR